MTDLNISLIFKAVDKASKPLQGIAGAIARVQEKAGIAPLQEIGRRVGVATRAVGALGAATAGAATLAGGAAFRLVQSLASAGDAAAKTADKLGVNIEWLQRYKFAAGLAGVEAGTFDMALQRFTRRAAEAAEGTGAAKDALEELGIQLTDSEGRMRPTETLLNEVGDALANVEDQQRRVSLAFKLFDSEGVGLVNFLQNGSAAMAQTAAEADHLGLVISEKTARQSEEFNDNITRLSGAVTGLGRAIATRLLPVISPLIGKLSEWIANNRDLIAQKFDQFFNQVIDAAPKVLDAVSGLGDVFRGLGDVIKFLADVFERIEPIGRAFWKLSMDLWKFWGGVGDELAAVFDRVSAAAEKVGKTIEDITGGVGDVFKSIGHTFGFGDDTSANASKTVREIPSKAAASRAEVDGRIAVEIKSDRPVRTKEVKSKGIEIQLGIDQGQFMLP